MAKLHDYYRDQVVNELKNKFGYKSVMQVPRIEKITLNMGVGEALTCQLSAKKDLRALPGGLFGNYLVIETQSFNYTVASNTYRSVM